MKEKQDFQIFIISRFLVSIIYVVLSELLIWFVTDRTRIFFGERASVFLMIVGVVLMVIPIVVASLMFSKALMDEVNRMARQKEEMHQIYEKKRNLMLSDIAHDLRTPMTTIAGYSKALNDGMVTSEEKRKEYLEAIENKSQRMTDLINLLFEYVRLGSDNFTLRKESVDLAELLREIAASLYADVEEKGMEFSIQIPEESYKVQLDRVQFTRVVVNLINNAIKHNEAGTVIELVLQPSKEGALVKVSDNGGIIPPFLAEHIFEPFAMGDSSRTMQKGSGLGLSIAKKIVEMHGWPLELEQYYEAFRKSFIIQIKN